MRKEEYSVIAASRERVSNIKGPLFFIVAISPFILFASIVSFILSKKELGWTLLILFIIIFLILFYKAYKSK